MSVILTAAHLVARNVVQKHLGIARAHATEIVRGLALKVLEDLKAIGESATHDGDLAKAKLQINSILEGQAHVRAVAHKQEVDDLHKQIADLKATGGVVPVAEAACDELPPELEAELSE